MEKNLELSSNLDTQVIILKNLIKTRKVQRSSKELNHSFSVAN